MRKQIVLPELGAAPAFLSAWFAEPGETVFEGDRLIEVLVGGATFDVAAPATGQLAERLVFQDEPIAAGQVLGMVEMEEEDGMPG
jgi:pyruvate/2-oxoglutarate dehydrogenase complex dihydrolipoamide acyltransferase (E2) component